jgi:hypothetical protein
VSRKRRDVVVVVRRLPPGHVAILPYNITINLLYRKRIPSLTISTCIDNPKHVSLHSPRFIQRHQPHLNFPLPRPNPVPLNPPTIRRPHHLRILRPPPNHPSLQDPPIAPSASQNFSPSRRNRPLYISNLRCRGSTPYIPQNPRQNRRTAGSGRLISDLDALLRHKNARRRRSPDPNRKPLNKLRRQRRRNAQNPRQSQHHRSTLVYNRPRPNNVPPHTRVIRESLLRLTATSSPDFQSVSGFRAEGGDARYEHSRREDRICG